MIVDSHCHLNYGSLAEDMDGVLARAAENGVGTMLAINARLSEYEDVLKIAEAHDHIWALWEATLTTLRTNGVSHQSS